jgi:hypothetical protein
MARNLNGALLSIVVSVVTLSPAFASGNNLIINDGMGEQVTVQKGIFGRKTEIVKDRLGDGYATQKGLFGQREKDVNILGNSFQSKKGILGGSDLKGSSIFGDRIESKKGIFGRRTTYVDVSGSASVIRNLWDQNKSKILGDNAAGNPLAALGGLGGAGMPPAGAGIDRLPAFPNGDAIHDISPPASSF